MTDFERFVDAYHSHFTRDPNACLNKGVSRNTDRLPDPSDDERRRRMADAGELLHRVGQLQDAPLDFEQTLDLDLARLSLEAELHSDSYTFNGRTRAQQLPRAGDDVGDGLFLMFVNDPRPAGERLADITARLEQVPDFVEAMLGRLDTPLARWTSMDIEKVEGLPGLLQTIDDWAEQERFADLTRLRRARTAAEGALSSYLERLRRLPTSDRLHVGDAICRRIVANRGIELSLEQLHATAQAFLANGGELIEQLRVELVQKYQLAPDTDATALHEHLKQRHAVAVPDGNLDAVLVRYEQERAKVLEFIEQRDLFPIFAEQDIKLIRTPPFMVPSIPAGAMMPPPPFREGVGTSVVYLTLSEALLPEHTELGIPIMMIHEGIPGHHLQLAWAARHPSIIRRHFEAMEQAEGWTTMLEDYMLDVGYMGELTDEARFCGKYDLARIGARVAIDLFFMTGDRGYLELGIDCDLSPADPFGAAGNLLAAVTGFTPGRVQAELNWYSQERGYPLCYLTGNRLVLELKRDVVQAMQGELTDLELDRAFHRTFLEAGSMPVAHLRRVYAQQGMLG